MADIAVDATAPRKKRGILRKLLYTAVGLAGLLAAVSLLGGSGSPNAGRLSASELAMAPDTFKTTALEVTYEQLARSPEAYKGKLVKVTGQIIQVLEQGRDAQYRVSITRKPFGWSDAVLAQYTRAEGEARLLEKDVVTLYGKFTGVTTYKSVMGGQVSAPFIAARFVEKN